MKILKTADKKINDLEQKGNSINKETKESLYSMLCLTLILNEKYKNKQKYIEGQYYAEKLIDLFPDKSVGYYYAGTAISRSFPDITVIPNSKLNRKKYELYIKSSFPFFRKAIKNGEDSKKLGLIYSEFSQAYNNQTLFYDGPSGGDVKQSFKLTIYYLKKAAQVDPSNKKYSNILKELEKYNL